MKRGSPPKGAEQAFSEGIDVFIARSVFEKIENESISALARGEEVLGLLYGSPFQFRGRLLLTVSGLASLPTNASPHHASVDHESKEPIKGDGWEGNVVVGWYHSHTGVGNFMSATDEITHRKWFNSPYAVSVIFEAVEKTMKMYRLKNDVVGRVDYAEYTV